MSHLAETNGKPIQPKFLDLSPIKPNSKEEVNSALHKVSELKLRPEKIPDEEDVVRPSSWKSGKDSPYLDPVPPTMLHVNIRELSTVSIDWKMLTLDRPEAQAEIQIFSRMVYLDKLMLQCVMDEKNKKAREKYVRLRTKGRYKPPSDSGVDKSDEFTYEYFSRLSGLNERPQAVDEVPKPKPAEIKPRPNPVTPVPPPNRTPVPPVRRTSKKPPAKKKLKKRRKKKKIRRKPKLRKRKLATTTKPKLPQRPKPTQRGLGKAKTKKPAATTSWKKRADSKHKQRKHVAASKTTLVQMLKAKELKEKRQTAGRKSETTKLTPRKNDDHSPKS